MRTWKAYPSVQFSWNVAPTRLVTNWPSLSLFCIHLDLASFLSMRDFSMRRSLTTERHLLMVDFCSSPSFSRFLSCRRSSSLTWRKNKKCHEGGSIRKSWFLQKRRCVLFWKFFLCCVGGGHGVGCLGQTVVQNLTPDVAFLTVRLCLWALLYSTILSVPAFHTFVSRRYWQHQFWSCHTKTLRILPRLLLRGLNKKTFSSYAAVMVTPKMKKLALQFETATTSTMLFFAGRQVAKTKHCKNIFVKPTEILFQIPLPVYRDGLEEIHGLSSFLQNP